MKPIKTMFGVAAALAATALGGWTHAAPSACETHMAELQASYARQSGGLGPVEMMSGCTRPRAIATPAKASSRQRC